MGAYLNALREEGTKEDLLLQIERLLDERDKLNAAHNATLARLAEAVKVMRRIQSHIYNDNGEVTWSPLSIKSDIDAFLAKLEGRS